jgi:hypothetical protein
MGGGGALVWFTVPARKRAVRCERRKGSTGGVHTEPCALGALKLFARAEEKSFNRCSGCAIWLEVGGQFIVP